jgi:hypothetical protein
MNTLMMAPR